MSEFDYEKYERTQDHLHEAIQQTNDDNNEVAGALLLNWVVVAEWAAVDGHKWMTHIYGKNATVWGTKGMLHQVLDGMRDG